MPKSSSCGLFVVWSSKRTRYPVTLWNSVTEPLYGLPSKSLETRRPQMPSGSFLLSRAASALETLVGYLHLRDPERLAELLEFSFREVSD